MEEAMQIDAPEQTRFESITYRVETPDGTMFVDIMESNDGRPIGMQINIGKAGIPLAAWGNAFARMVTLALDKGVPVNDLIRELSNTTASSTPRIGRDGSVVRSGPEGVCVALMQYRKSKYRELMETLNGPNEDDGEEDRPASVAM